MYTFNWQPELEILQKLINLADSTGQAPEDIVTEAIKLYLEKQKKELKIYKYR